jgi:hypothetical protein
MTLWDTAKTLVSDAMQKVFAETVTYEQPGQNSVQIQAIFTERYQLVEVNAEAAIQSTATVFDIQLDALSFRPKQGDTITRENDDAYEVTKVEPDGEGGAKLIAMKRRR